jgi:hypothetical protein
MAEKTYQGGCHCGAVRFEAAVDLAAGTFRCNCSICYKSRAWMAAVPGSGFRLLAGEDKLRDYQFGQKRIHHLFCTVCGVRPFARGQDGKGNPMVVVRVNCLEGADEKDLVDAPVRYFDMRHDNFKTPPAETRHL